MKNELDLYESLRPGLDILANEIIISLKKRIRFPQNREIYEPGLVIGKPDVPLLDYELHKVEEIHAELGRYLYANQEAFTDVSHIKPVIKREPPPCPIQNIPTNLGGAVKKFYVNWIMENCAPGSDSDAYGETVTADTAALLNFLERIKLGEYVAESKFQNQGGRLRETGGDSAAIREVITHPDREARVIEMAGRLGEHYEFPPDQARAIFRWLIDRTVEVQIAYLQARLEG